MSTLWLSEDGIVVLITIAAFGFLLLLPFAEHVLTSHRYRKQSLLVQRRMRHYECEGEEIPAYVFDIARTIKGCCLLVHRGSIPSNQFTVMPAPGVNKNRIYQIQDQFNWELAFYRECHPGTLEVWSIVKPYRPATRGILFACQANKKSF